MSTRARKKAKFDQAAGYHDSVPSATIDYNNVHLREERTRKVGISTVTAPQASRVVHMSDEDWKSTKSWVVLDDPNFALDPDGDWYDEAVEGPVMQQDHPSAKIGGQVKKRIRSKVSVGLKSCVSQSLTPN
jgi:hypothetical protein